MRIVYDTRESIYCQNICIWFDGTIRPMKGHNGTCRWVYDGQVYYHQPTKANKENDKCD